MDQTTPYSMGTEAGWSSLKVCIIIPCPTTSIPTAQAALKTYWRAPRDLPTFPYLAIIIITQVMEWADGLIHVAFGEAPPPLKK